MSNVIAPERIVQLNRRDPRSGDFVLYWMQQSQRAKWNHALEDAAKRANELKLPLVVCFGLTRYPEANARHYTFMLEGLAETAETLAKRRIKFVLQLGDPAEVALRIGKKAAVIVCDRGYLRIQKEWRRKVAKAASCAVVQVESDAIVPVRTASTKSEFAARTIRPKLLALRDQFLVEFGARKIERSAAGINLPGEDLGNPTALLRKLKVDQSVGAVTKFFRGGAVPAKKIFSAFLRDHLPHYAENRNQPQTNDVSHMSKYLHFGQVSPLWLALEARKQKSPRNVYSFIEELLVRRELAMNFCEFNENYDSYEVLPDWARKTLAAHRRDKRELVYSREQLEAAETHDEYWNAAMREMRFTGFMHNYMRMYWGKKILEWSPTPEKAYATTLAINNKYFLDGRDPNSFAGVGWIFGLHDRPWFERPIFGTVRYMNAAGLERKCDIRAYVEKVDALVAQV